MSSDPFDLLGLDPGTATEADVRRAYAERLKVTRPEEDRAGFMALREAFERARERVRWRGDEIEPYEEDDEDAEVEVVETALPDVAVVDIQAVFAQDDDAEGDPDGYAYEASPAEIAFDERINRAMDTLVDVLTGSPFGPAPARVAAVIDADEVGGIEEYQAMQWRVRQLLCDRTGLHLDPPEKRLPDWLTLAVFDTLDQYYGWTRQPSTNGYVRRLNDWMAGVRKKIEWDTLSKSQQDQLKHTALERRDLMPDSPESRKSMWSTPEGGEDGSSKWLWIGAGILIFQVVRVLEGLGGG